MKYNTYFAFENALEACKYYEQNFHATISEHMSLTREVADEFNLDKSLDLSTTTFFVKLNIFGVDFIASDRFDTSEFSDSVNLCISFDASEIETFSTYVDLVSKSEGIEILFNNIDDDNQTDKMFRFRDQQNLIWSLFLNN